MQAGSMEQCGKAYPMHLIMLQYLPSPQAWPSSPVCFSKAANTNLDTVSSRDSLLRDALSQSANEDMAQSVHCQVIFRNNGSHYKPGLMADLC